MKLLRHLLTGLGLVVGGLVMGAQGSMAEPIQRTTVDTPLNPNTATVALSFEISSTSQGTAAASDGVGLSFDLSAVPAAAIELVVAPKPSAVADAETVILAVPEPPPLSQSVSEVAALPPPPDVARPSSWDLADLFEGGSDSLVAHAVGHAEGTRTADGGYTRYYNGHTDPGNGVWNLGTFSYQHGASSAAEADAKQLARLQRQATELRQQAEAKGIELTLLEELNGIDLANQAPVTALDRGYIKWLERAKQTDMNEAERVVWARTRSFIHPDTGRWNAPGLGNTLESVTRDQRRRQQAISQVLEDSPARL